MCKECSSSDLVADGVARVVRGAQVEPPLHEARRRARRLEPHDHAARLEHVNVVVHRRRRADVAGEDRHAPARSRVLEDHITGRARLEALPRPRPGEVHVDDLVVGCGASDPVAGHVAGGARAAVPIGHREVVGAGAEAGLRRGAGRQAAGATVDGAPGVGVAGAVAADERVEVAARRLAEGERRHHGLGHRDRVGGGGAALRVDEADRVGAGADEPRVVARAAGAGRAAGGVTVVPQCGVGGRAALRRGEVDHGSGRVAARIETTEGPGVWGLGNGHIDRVADEGKVLDDRASCNAVVEQLHAEDVGTGVVVDVGDVKAARRAGEGGGRRVGGHALAGVVTVPDDVEGEVAGRAGGVREVESVAYRRK
mmetsp:Transcript_10354/g.42105  ORF Transcript_10354/g.42105 Transcript_10354/m.42105 type:complete len:369 (+) Transcript_10354:138-1244(+)